MYVRQIESKKVYSFVLYTKDTTISIESRTFGGEGRGAYRKCVDFTIESPHDLSLQQTK